VNDAGNVHWPEADSNERKSLCQKSAEPVRDNPNELATLAGVLHDTAEKVQVIEQNA